jgi:hypothetical protein
MHIPNNRNKSIKRIIVKIIFKSHQHPLIKIESDFFLQKPILFIILFKLILDKKG